MANTGMVLDLSINRPGMTRYVPIPEYQKGWRPVPHTQRESDRQAILQVPLAEAPPRHRVWKMERLKVDHIQ